ncbi:MAG: cytochrome c oxidase assembly protein [Sphingomonadaceae bacterium]
MRIRPEQAGRYSNKIQCFWLHGTDAPAGPAGQRMPVLYFVDPAALDGPE